MKRILKCLSVIIAMLITLFSFSITALAQTTTQDGLQVNLTTNKQSYSLNEDIEITVSVTNTNDFTVEDVSIEALLPDKFELKDSSQNTSLKAIDLKGGEQVSLTVVAVVKGEEQNVTNPTESTVEPNTEPSDTTKPITKPVDTTEPTTNLIGSNTDSTQNTKSNVQTTTSIISNNDNIKSDNSDNNTKNNSNQDNTSIKTGADYAYMGIFIVLLLASISTLLYCLIKHFNKTTKIVSSVLCVVIAVTSVVGISKFNTFAEESNSTAQENNSTITLSEQIKVDNKDYTISANIEYRTLLSGGTIVNRNDLIKDFTLTATPFDILVGQKTDVIFKAECNLSNSDNLNPVLYDEDDNFITYLFDNGENGDEIANDGIYSVKLNLYSVEEKFVNYYVFVNEKLASNAEEIFFYTNFTNEDLNEIVTFETELSKIENKYVQSNGYTKEKDINAYLQEVCNLCEAFNQQVKSYDYDKDNNSVFIELNSGMTYLITPQIEGRLVGGSSNEIITVAPSQTSINTT